MASEFVLAVVQMQRITYSSKTITHDTETSRNNIGRFSIAVVHVINAQNSTT